MQQTTLGGAIKNNDWITDEKVQADPEVLPELPGFHILVRPISIKTQTKGGILLPDSTKDDIAYLTTVGKVLGVGDLAYQDTDKFPKGPWCKLNEWIIFSRYAGSRFKIDGGEVRVLNDDEVISTIKDPNDILHHY